MLKTRWWTLIDSTLLRMLFPLSHSLSVANRLPPVLPLLARQAHQTGGTSQALALHPTTRHLTA